MGNKAAGGPFQLEHAESPGLHVGTMSSNDVRDEGCASEGSGDDERAYVSSAEVDEAEAVVVAPSDTREDDTVNFTRNSSQSSMGKNRPPGSPHRAAPVGDPVAAPVPTDDQRSAEPVPPPPRASQSASASVSPPRAPGTSDLQLPPLNDPHPLPALEEAARLASRGSPSSADGRDQKGAHVEVSVFKYQPGVQTPIEQLHNYRISSRGAAITGSLSQTEERRAESVSGSVDIAAEYEKRKGSQVARHHIKDHRAKQLLVVPNDDKFVAVAAPEAFSRHSGTCMILGGQGAYGNGAQKSYELKLGNFLRIGSVGVVVSEIHTGVGGEHKCLSWEELTCLKGDIAAIQKDLVTIEALTAQEENAEADKLIESLQNGVGGAVHTTRMCYMCFDDVDEPSNPLVAPCECRGDTRYVHLNCLQKWHTTTSENKVCVVLNNKGVRVCTVCKSPYKASVRLPGGESVSLFQSPLPPPYICFMVVTRHQNNEVPVQSTVVFLPRAPFPMVEKLMACAIRALGSMQRPEWQQRLHTGHTIRLYPLPLGSFLTNMELFSTKYQLSFSSVMNRAGTASNKELVVGRSRQCDMVLDYRTVSTRHASVRFQGGKFYFSDLMSSNGSYLYLREPLQLPYGETVYLKWGSNVVSLKAKRSIRHRLSNLVGRRATVTNKKDNPEQEFTMLESLCELGQSPSTDGAADGGVEATAARERGSL